jgi:hypothetical protein
MMSVHEDTLQGLNEALDYVRGSIQLKATTVEVSDEEITFYNIYAKLSDSGKAKLMNYANDLLKATNA